MLRKILFILIAVAAAIPVSAVTDREMEEARAITAKAYLRYANNGSGYLDEITAKSMSELESKLKAKEKENLAAFKSVKVPSDYASWDKEKLVEFWAVTFFTSPALDANGKAAKSRVRKQISAMTVSAPTKETPAATPEPAAEETPAPQSAEANPAEQPQEVTAEAAMEAQEEILADQEAIQKDAEEAQPVTPQQESHTCVYVLVLVILVGIVIWLVVYAANLMKRQPDAAVSGSKSADASADDDELRQQTRKAIAKKNEEVAELHRRLQAEEEKSAAIGLELERMKLERSRLEDKLATLREENARLQQAPAPAPQPAAHRSAPAYENTSAAEHAAIQPAPAPVYDTPAAEPRRERPVAEQPANARVLKVIYLGRANNRGIFVRADRRINPGNTIYRLDTNDGLVGTFHVVDEPEVVETAITAPMDYLANGCLGEDLNDTRGVTRIITESPGTAIFENGYWKVLRKSRIRYE